MLEHQAIIYQQSPIRILGIKFNRYWQNLEIQLKFIICIITAILIQRKRRYQDQIHKSHNASVAYNTMQHSEQKCAHFWYEWCIVGYGTVHPQEKQFFLV